MKSFEEDTKHLKSAEKKCLISDLIDIIEKNAFRHFSCIVENKVMQSSLSAQVRKKYFLNAYVLAARSAVAMLGEYRRCQKMHSPLQLVFEKGDIGEGKLRKRLTDDGYLEPVFRTRTDRIIKGNLHPGFLPLQACDLLAHEIFVTARDHKLKEPGWIFKRFWKMAGNMGQCLVEDHKEMKRWAKVSEAVDVWALDKGLLLPKGTKIKTVTITKKGGRRERVSRVP